MDKPNFTDLQKAVSSKGFKIFTEPYKLNIVGIRSADPTPNKFNDLLCAFYKNKDGKWEYGCWKATTDPGLLYLGKKMGDRLGTAAVKSGQYPNSHRMGYHNNYKALVQNGNLDVYRDANRNNILDFYDAKVYKTNASNGINIHRAALGTLVEDVDNWSAGCQVFQSDKDFATFMAMAEKSKAEHGNIYTYTLLDEKELLAKDLKNTVRDAVRFVTPNNPL